MPLSGFDPLITEWFTQRFAGPTDPQVRGWPEIRAGRDVLISAPTGSGKTLAAFLICLDGLVRRARSGPLPQQCEVVYVSPLKALSNDIRKNLELPLGEIAELARARGISLGRITTAVRTGDTPVWNRQEMLREPPHVLVTTPESLFILLTAERSRKMLSTARTVIVDEIHAVADDKRGSHLSLSIERLEALARGETGRPLQRIGLSATVSPLEEVAAFLSPRAEVIHIGHRRAMELGVESPRDELGPVASNEMWAGIYDRLALLIQENRTTLIFVNTRRLCERVSHHLGERLGEAAVLPHHGSLSRRLRLTAEERLKNGELRAVVATASLELGIDIGTVDLVCQIGSPRSIAVSLQRIGRSGHWVGARPKGRLFATTRDELIECAAVVSAIQRGTLDRLEIPSAPLDVLAQQIVAAAASEDWREEDLLSLVRRAYPYRDLAQADFDAIVDMLSEGIATARGRSGAFLHRDRVNGRVRGRRGARLAAITSGGAIPENASYSVVAEPEGAIVGTLDEDFAVESLAGDIFLLGTTSWRIRRVEPGRVRVEDAHGAPPSVPFWRGEAPGRTVELSLEVSRVREEIIARSGSGGTADVEAAINFLLQDCGLDRRGAEQAVAYVRAGKAMLGSLPTSRTVVAERFFDEAGGMQLVIHAPFGARINRAWGLALRKRFCRSFNLELQAAATDNGIVISLSEQHSFPLEIIFNFLKPETLEHVLTQAMLDAPMFTARWRWNLGRALAILRFAGGRRVPPPIQRMRSDDLLAAVFPDQAACAENLSGEIRIPDHPLVAETINNCLYEAMDLNGLKRVISEIESGAIRTAAIDTAEASVFSHEILNANPYAYLDDAPLEERRARAVQLRRSVRPHSDAGDLGALDAGAIEEVRQQSWPVVRDADELHDALMTLTVLPPQHEWEAFFARLVEDHRAAVLSAGPARFWVAAEGLPLAHLVYPAAAVELAIPSPPSSRPLPEGEQAAVAAVLRGWLESTGPITASELAIRLALAPPEIAPALAMIEGEGQILRGYFTPGRMSGEVEWCNRRLLARIHRLTLGRLRREIEPVTSADFMRFLSRWQHLAQGTQLHGPQGVLEIIRQLQGYEISAGAWEAGVLARRVAKYSPDLLDAVCLSGEVMWGRLSRHPAFETVEERKGNPRHPGAGDGGSQPDGANRGVKRRIRPTRAAPLALFLREDAEWLLASAELDGTGVAIEAPLSHQAREVREALQTRGALFFGELQRATRRLPSEVEDALWELVAAGLVTADGFENLRSLVTARRRRGEGRGRTAMPRHAAGRWALLKLEAAAADRDRVCEFFARQMLRRWGVVFRDLLVRETLAPAWRDLLVVLRRMEARGEIRGGRFVSGYSGEQYAMPEAVELLRSVRRSAQAGEAVQISAADPLNLVGVILPGTRESALAGRWLMLREGASLEAASF